MDKRLDKLFSKIMAIIKKSKVPEDPLHAKDTLEILLLLAPDASIPLQIAALGHDIERALPDTIKAKRASFPNYDLFKLAHSENSARILKALVLTHGLSKDIANKVYKIVVAHEFGGFFEADLLKEADSLSFFNTNLPFYKKRESEEEVIRRIRWGLKRLGKRAIKILPDFTNDSLVLQEREKYIRFFQP